MRPEKKSAMKIEHTAPYTMNLKEEQKKQNPNNGKT